MIEVITLCAKVAILKRRGDPPKKKEEVVALESMDDIGPSLNNSSDPL